MGQILTSAALNNLSVDGVYVYLQPPSILAGAGIQTTKTGFVGSGSWGPLNSPLPFSDTGSLFAQFGTFSTGGADPYSILPEAMLALPYVQNCIGVRISDGTDVAASGAFKDTGNTNGLTISALYSGSEGNNISVTLQTGSNNTAGAPTMTATLARLGYVPEVYPNLANPNAGGFALNLKNAINTGITGVRPASQIALASLIGTSVAAFAVNSGVSLAGGTNGGSPTSSQQVGSDGTGSSRTGIYAMRGTGVQQFILCGNSDSTQYNVLATFAQSEGSLAICALPSGTSTTTAQATKQTANLNSIYAVLVKDWVYWTNPLTGAVQLVSPLGVVAGVIAALSPEASPGNKPIGGVQNILYTDRMQSGPSYSQGEQDLLEKAGIMYLTKPIPRGGIIGFPHGENSSGVTGSGTDTVAYTRMTNFLAYSVLGMLGPFIGELQSSAKGDPTRRAARAVLTGFLQDLVRNNRIQSYSVQLDAVINTPTTIAQGYCLAYVSVQYMGIIKYFLVTLQGGQQTAVTFGPTNIV